MPYNFNPFTGNFDQIIEGGKGGIPEVATFADLPDATTVSGQLYRVLTTTGVIFVNRQKRGVYKSNGTSWEYFPNFTAADIPVDTSTIDLNATTTQGAIEELSQAVSNIDPDGTVVYKAQELGVTRLQATYNFTLNSSQNINILRVTQEGSQKNITSTRIYDGATQSPNPTGIATAISRITAAFALNPNPVTVRDLTIEFDQVVNNTFIFTLDVDEGLFTTNDISVGVLRSASYSNENFVFLENVPGPVVRILKKTYDGTTTWALLDEDENEIPISEPDFSEYVSVEVESYTEKDAEIKDLIIKERVRVESPQDLLNIDSSKLYQIDGSIDMGSTQIQVPSSGLYMQGLDYSISKLYSSEDDHTMFVNKAGEDAGNIRISEVSVYSSGTNSKIFDISNTTGNAFLEVDGFNFGDFSVETTSLGEVTGYRQVRTNNCAFIRVADGLTLSGTMPGGISTRQTVILAPVSGATIFKEGTSLVIQDSLTSDINALSIDSSTAVFDFQPSNFTLDWGFALSGARFPDGSDPVPNMPLQSPKRYFKGNRGILNTFSGGRFKFTTEAQTNITSSGTAVKLAGTTTYDNLVHFSSTGNNAITCITSVETDYKIKGNLVIDGGPNDVLTLTIRKWDNSASAYVDLDTFTRGVTNAVGGTDIAIFTVDSNAILSNLDRIEVWIQNDSDTTNVTALTGSYIVVDER